MLQLLKAHKKTIIIISIAILICAALVVALVSRSSPAAANAPPGRIHDAGILDDSGEILIHDSTEGEVIITAAPAKSTAQLSPIPSILSTTSDPDLIWTDETYAGNHTPAERAQMTDGSIGVLTIPKLGLSVNVYESPDNMEAMLKGVAHFPHTSAWDGNVALSAHNINMDGSDGYFKDLHTLEKGDHITYQTALGERAYTVESVAAIAASDWSPLGYTDDNRLTMITCISGQPDKRLCVTAVENPAV
jgi:LPXTG-site transpeptidase (sortase) family protein